VPVCIALLASDVQPLQVRLLAKFAVFASLMWWARLAGESSADGAGFARAYGSPAHLIWWVPHATMAFISLGAKAGKDAAALYYCSWFVTQLLAETLKIHVQRPRPAVALAGELAAVPRGSTQLARFVTHPRQAYMSFPSSDAAGGAVFVTSFAKSADLFEFEKTAIAVVAVLVCTCFGRVYFHTNHVLDTAMGLLMGVLCTMFVHFVTQPTCSWIMLFFSQLLALGLWPSLPTYSGAVTSTGLSPSDQKDE
jgi:membrane-associated phospholipid phosphatase